MATKPLRVGIVMDPIESITPYKDSSLAMLLEAERRRNPLFQPVGPQDRFRHRARAVAAAQCRGRTDAMVAVR
jgi:glutathione synthase